MLELLQTGKALYVLAAICALGVLSKWLTRNLYKRLIKETDNMTLTKNRNLRAFKQKAETTYQMNQGIAKVGPYLERQMYDFKYMGISLNGWSMLSNQMTLWCFLTGGAAAFAAYWYRTDPYYIVLYGSMGILSGLLTILVDHGTGIMEKKQQLFVSLENYLENTMFYRMDQERKLNPASSGPHGGEVRENIRPLRAAAPEPAASKAVVSIEEGADKKLEHGSRRQRTRTERLKNQIRISQDAEVLQEPEQDMQAGNDKEKEVAESSRRDVDYLKHSLEQIAVSRDRERDNRQGEDWLKDLNPEELKLIGEILHEYLT